jgi:septum formation protein
VCLRSAIPDHPITRSPINDPIIALVRLILASASPRRAELLRAAGFEFDIRATAVDERVREGEAPSTYVRRLAAEKSFVASGFSRTSQNDDAAQGPPKGGRHVRDDDAHGPPEGGHHVRSDDVLILAADTAVIVDGTILGKPEDDAAAARMLRALAGRQHDVLTGVSLRRNADEVGRVETTAVFFTSLSDDDVRWYVASGEGRDKAGGYAIQGLASRFIRRIEGSYSNVVGLPVAAVVELLRELGGGRSG